MPARIRTFKNVNTPHSVIKAKGKLIKIDFKDKEEKIKRMWEGKPPTKLVERWKREGVSISNAIKYYSPPSMQSRYNAVKRLIGYNNNKVGYCSVCRNINMYLLKQKVSGVVIVTRFCDKHVPDKI